ncbi:MULTISPECIES: ABC transporter ATP-binding protein [unclassified Variovorax]|uniref:ABC transporter ATP-binding protein n=1 Tax=unclassified Variovorax TaxID=663243 RepID=UPI001316A39B|nr:MULTISPECIES: polyamine ABC transporter ATP-binding protein [unclassified Variovorax]VTU14697.1 Spermidine/putrescine import ATP-binding protein PotA [Variovorax sp. SRS16]VTU21508.1 Spermidine/putrescine import ATP-binding protein PotA [Variovorax sp. PBL-E5]
MNASGAPGAFLRIEAVTKDFGDFRAVDQVSLDVARGEIFALLGSSGCGKSTLLRILAGFEAPSSGRVVLDGVDLAGRPPYERPVNMMFQSYALFPHLTVRDNIAFGLRRDKLPKAEIAARVDEMLRLVQLTALAGRKPHQLSGGQQQRVALARSLAKRPQLLLLDEPLGALDKKLREATQIELVNIIRQVGVTCVLVTHDQEEAMTMASRMAVMSEGRFLQVGSPADVYETPATRFVADFIGNVNLMDGVIETDEADHVDIRCADVLHRVGHGITGYQGQTVTVAVRPEKIHLCASEPEDDHNKARGVVRASSYFGVYTVYHLELASGAALKVNVENETRHREGVPVEGDAVWAHWLPTSQVVLTQ